MTTDTQIKPLYTEFEIQNIASGVAYQSGCGEVAERYIYGVLFEMAKKYEAALAAARADVEEAERERDIAADDAIFQNDELIKAQAQLAAAPQPVEMSDEVWEMLDKVLSYWYAACHTAISSMEDIDTERRRISEVAVWLEQQRPGAEVTP